MTTNREVMYTWLLLGFIVLGVALLFMLRPQLVTEGMTVDPDTALTQRQSLQLEGERRFNDVARLQAPSASVSPDAVTAAIQGTMPVPSSAQASLLSLVGSSLGFGAADAGTGKQGSGLEQTGVAQAKINFCESLTTVDCDQLDDPRLAECGFCHRDGTDSKGKAHRGGMYISADDQIRAGEVSNANGQTQAQYAPTVGQCLPQNFTLVKDRCIARELQMQCQSAGAPTTTNNCGQCYGAAPANATGLIYMGPQKQNPYQVFLHVTHPGFYSGPRQLSVEVRLPDGTYAGISYVPGLAQTSVFNHQVTSFYVKEGDNIQVTVYGPPTVWAAWLSNGYDGGNRTVSLDIGVQAITPTDGMMIVGDKRSNPVAVTAAAADPTGWVQVQNLVPNTVMWYGRRDELVTSPVTQAVYGLAAPGAAGASVDVTPLFQSMAGAGNDIAISPSLLAQGGYSDPAPGVRKTLWLLRDRAPPLLTGDGATLPGSSYASAAGFAVQIPATLVDPPIPEDMADCPTGPIVTTPVGAGLMGSHSCFKADGSFNPTAYCLKELYQGAGGLSVGTDYPATDAQAATLVVNNSLDDTVAALNQLGNIALYGVKLDGSPVDFATFKDASMRMLGTTPQNVCDGPNATTGPQSPECLAYLWTTAGGGRNGTLAPLNPDGSVNSANVSAANALGSVSNIRNYYASIGAVATSKTPIQTNADFVTRNAASEQWTGARATEPPPVPFSCTPEVFITCPGPGAYSLTSDEAAGACAALGARLATPDEITAAQQLGANWCRCGWASDGSAYFPMNKIVSSYGYGCGSEGRNNCGQVDFAGNKGCATCFGKKPTGAAATAAGVLPFSQAIADDGTGGAITWNAPNMPFVNFTVSISPAANLNVFLRHASFHMYANTGGAVFANDSSFLVVPAINGASGFVSFQSVNFTSRHLRGVLGGQCQLADNDGSQAYLDDCTFAIVPALNGNPTHHSIQLYTAPNQYLTLSPQAPDQVWALVPSGSMDAASWRIQRAQNGVLNANL